MSSSIGALSAPSSESQSEFPSDERTIMGICLMGERENSYGIISDADAGSLCSSPSSLKVRLRNTFLDFKEMVDPVIIDGFSPRADSIVLDSVATSPLRRSQSDVTGVDVYIRQRLGSNAGVPVDSVEVEGDCGFSPIGQLSPMSRLAQQAFADSAREGVSILSFSPPTFQHSAFIEGRNHDADFVMVMEEDPPAPKPRPPSIVTSLESSRSTRPSTPTPLTTPTNPSSGDDRVTVMLRNIPNKYSQRMLLNEINSCGFEGQYDLLYLPLDFKNRCNVGYAFINFTSNRVAVRFIDRFTGYKLPGFNSQKICEVSWARVQGLKANIQHFKNSPINNVNIPDSRPLLFAHGQEIEFPFVGNRSH
jgi:hypothetical protein